MSRLPSIPACSRLVILGDLHGRRDHAEALLRAAGAIDETGRRIEGIRTLSVGDVVSLGYDQDEIDFLEWIWPHLDDVVWGNHELHHVWHNQSDMAFTGAGRETDPETDAVIFEHGADPEAVQFIRDRKSELIAATSVGDWLITHAGLHPRYQQAYVRAEATAADIADDLQGRFERCWNEGLPFGAAYDDVITRTSHADGGIFWLRADNLEDAYQLPSAEGCVAQVFGHTPYAGPELMIGEQLWCIDGTGGGAALVTDDMGTTMRLVTVSV
jgi:hypothetical protein